MNPKVVGKPTGDSSLRLKLTLDSLIIIHKLNEERKTQELVSPKFPANLANSKLIFDGKFTKILGLNKGLMTLEDVGT